MTLCIENPKVFTHTQILQLISKFSKGTGLKMDIKKSITGTSLVAQWLRICLPMQETRVRSLVWEDPACHRATKPVCHNYWACALEPASHNYWACVPQLLKPACLEPMLLNERSHRNENPRTAMKSSPRSEQPEKACVQQQRLNTAINK